MSTSRRCSAVCARAWWWWIRSSRIRVWNRRAEDLWGIRKDEAVGLPFLGLDIGLPVADLAEPIRNVMSGQQLTVVKTITSTTRKGKSIQCQVSVVPLAAIDQHTAGVILLMDEPTSPK